MQTPALYTEIGRYIIRKYVDQAKLSPYKAAANMRKQGYPIELARTIIALSIVEKLEDSNGSSL